MAESSLNLLEANKENNSSRLSSLPNNLPPITSKKARPRLLSNAKETKNSIDNSKEDLNDISAQQNDRSSRKSLERSSTEVKISNLLLETLIKDMLK